VCWMLAEHVATCGVWVDAVGLEEGRAVPEKIKIIDKVEASSVAGRLEPGFEQEQSGEARIPATKCGNGTRDEDRFSTGAQKIQEGDKGTFGQFRGALSQVIGPSVHQYAGYGGWK